MKDLYLRLKKRANVIGFTILFCFALVGFYNQSELNREICTTGNEVRTEFIQYIDSQVSRAESALRGTLNSPSSTEQEKKIAEDNLEKLEKFVTDAKETLKQVDCP